MAEEERTVSERHRKTLLMRRSEASCNISDFWAMFSEWEHCSYVQSICKVNLPPFTALMHGALLCLSDLDTTLMVLQSLQCKIVQCNLWNSLGSQNNSRPQHHCYLIEIYWNLSFKRFQHVAANSTSSHHGGISNLHSHGPLCGQNIQSKTWKNMHLLCGKQLFKKHSQTNIGGDLGSLSHWTWLHLLTQIKDYLILIYCTIS